MTTVDLGATLRAGLFAEPGSVAAVVADAASAVGASDVVVYLADFGQTILQPLPGPSTGSDVGPEDIGTTMAGRAFLTQRAVSAERPDGHRVWVPIVEGTDRRGVLALTLDAADGPTLRSCEDLALLAGHLIGTDSRFTDLYDLSRRRREMTLAASMQWDLLPPPVLKTAGVEVAGMLEPAYEVGGDCFDYAVNGSTLDLAVFDAMGHGVSSALVCALAVGCYRHDRRGGLSLPVVHAGLDATLASQFGGSVFTTGQLVRLDTDHGILTWTNAGHPQPLLVRDGRVHELSCPPTVPWGVGVASVWTRTEALQPGDRVLLYTDGVVDARRSGGRDFGIGRLTDLVSQKSSNRLPVEEIVRLVVGAVLEHHAYTLADDATVVMLHWQGR